MFKGEDISKAIQFITTDIWRVRAGDLSPNKSLWIRILRILILTIRGIVEDRWILRASALTYYSLLSIVPVFAMIFGIAKGFGLEKALEKLLYENLEGQEQIIQKVVDFAHALLQNVKGGLVAGIGLLILFYTIIKILSQIENAFNDIWGIKNARSLGRKITDYLSLMLISPFLFFISSTITVVINSGAKYVIEKISLLATFSPIIFFMLKLLPYGVIWVLFSFIYIFIPNTKVRWRSGIMAGVIAGTLYVVFQFIYINFQIGVAKYNAIYGSFAALPLFIIWLQLSWVIVLFGAELAFAHQNVDTYEFEPDCENISSHYKRLLSLRIVQLLIKQFLNGEKGWSAAEISHNLEIPIRLVQQIIFELISSGILSEVKLDEGGEVGYHPARDPDTMTIKFVIDALEHEGSDNVPVAQSEELDKLSESLKAFSDLIEKSSANQCLKEI
jgi:membrane protein